MEKEISLGEDLGYEGSSCLLPPSPRRSQHAGERAHRVAHAPIKYNSDSVVSWELVATAVLSINPGVSV